MNIATHPFDALMDITARPPVVFVRGEGAFLWDDHRQALSRFHAGLGGQLPRPLPAPSSPRRSPRKQNCC